jgi:hypothetical protein
LLLARQISSASSRACRRSSAGIENPREMGDKNMGISPFLPFPYFKEYRVVATKLISCQRRGIRKVGFN